MPFAAVAVCVRYDYILSIEGIERYDPAHSGFVMY